MFEHDNDTDDIPFPDITHPVGETGGQGLHQGGSKYEHENDTDDIPNPDVTHPVRMNMHQKKRFEHSDDTEDLPVPDVTAPINDYGWRAQKDKDSKTYPAKDSHSKVVPYVVRDHAWNHDQYDHTHDASWD